MLKCEDQTKQKSIVVPEFTHLYSKIKLSLLLFSCQTIHYRLLLQHVYYLSALTANIIDFISYHIGVLKYQKNFQHVHRYIPVCNWYGVILNLPNSILNRYCTSLVDAKLLFLPNYQKLDVGRFKIRLCCITINSKNLLNRQKNPGSRGF